MSELRHGRGRPMEKPQTMCKSILILSDHESASQPLADSLVGQGYRVNILPIAPESLLTELQSALHMVLVDSKTLSLEDMAVCQQLRQIYQGPLMLLTSRLEEMLQVMALEMGVDDLVIMPVDPMLLTARIRAVARRCLLRSHQQNLTFGEIEIDGGLRSVRCRGHEVTLTSREFDLLWHLAQNARTAVSRDRLYQAVFGIEYNGHDRSIDMYVSRLRHKLEALPEKPRLLKTVRGVGYLLAASDET